MKSGNVRESKVVQRETTNIESESNTAILNQQICLTFSIIKATVIIFYFFIINSIDLSFPWLEIEAFLDSRMEFLNYMSRVIKSSLNLELQFLSWFDVTLFIIFQG